MSEAVSRECLEEIIHRIETIDSYVDDRSFAEFRKEERTVDAVVRNIAVIGDAANRLPGDFRDRYDQVEWRGVMKFREVVTGGSFTVDRQQIWDTVRKNLPVLKQQLEEILETDTFRELLRGSQDD